MKKASLFPVAVVELLFLFTAQIYPVISAETGDKSIQNDPGAIATVQTQLEARYLLAKTTQQDGAEITATGAVLVLQKDNLVMNKVYMQGTQRSSPVQNAYENGEITQVGLLGALSKINSFLSVLGKL